MLKHLEKGSEAQDNPLLRRQHGIAEGALALVMIPEIQSLICYEPVGCTQAINWSICPASLTCKMMVLNDLFCPFCLDSMRSCCLNDFGINREVRVIPFTSGSPTFPLFTFTLKIPKILCKTVVNAYMWFREQGPKSIIRFSEESMA